ncbi:hypothetical protein [Roseofilum capinflatum]|uniref:Telomere-associated protein Rif1 N-terminal domain-containing protein n=1 Tax=Roseofilum capinflatum BLCC-M114 TaxID=3022440 RepID=A0ABT7B211_9CYAN|nr:hypothetical protein [Roseofilum capinflatum]MDJ1173205.1 hypothetical protein [Roseofilum capinflatum BLCC-M114]
MARQVSLSDVAADNSSRFPSRSDIESVSNSLRKALVCLDAAESLSKNADLLTQDTAEFVFTKFPDAAKASSFLFDSLPEMESHSFQEDIAMLIRLLTYSLVAGSDTILEYEPLTEIFKSISSLPPESSQISPLWYVEAMEFIRNHHHLPEESALELSSYIDSIITALRPSKNDI